MLCSPVLISDRPALVAQATAPLPTFVSGSVRDTRTGAAVMGAFIQQDESVASAFSDRKGFFHLRLDRAGAAALTISASGYDTLKRNFSLGDRLALRLTPLRSFVPPNTDGVPNPATLAPLDNSPLNTGLLFAYSLRGVTWNTQGAAISGLANNNFSLGGRYRFSRWLVEFEGSHVSVPVDVSGLDTTQNPAFTPSTYQAGARLGYVWPLQSDLEGALALGYQYFNTVPNNNDVRYTDSPVDFEQTRQALGLVGTAAWRRANQPWHLEGACGVYPLVFAWAKPPGATFGSNFMLDARVRVSYEVLTGLRVGLGYQWQGWIGNGLDGSNLVTLSAFYTPAGLPAGPQ